MDICRVVHKADGSVAIIHPADRSRKKNETEQNFLNRVYTKAVKGTPLDGLPFEDVDPTTLPDRKDRDKWRKKAGGGVEVDLSVVTASDRREIDNAALQVERKKTVPNMKVALDLLLKLQENNYSG